MLSHITPFEVVYNALYARYKSSFVSVQDTADELSIHFTTARSWLSKGCFPLPTISLGSRRVVSLASLAAFVAGDAGNSPQVTEEESETEVGVTVEKAAEIDTAQVAEVEVQAADPLPQPQKKKLGRPRKLGSDAHLPKRRPGRPRKAILASEGAQYG